jgi:hypothetical protein
LSNEKGCKRLNHENDYRVVLAEIEKKTRQNEERRIFGK